MKNKYIKAIVWSIVTAFCGEYIGTGFALSFPLSVGNMLFSVQFSIVVGGISAVIMSLVLAFIIKRRDNAALIASSVTVFLFSLWFGYGFTRIIASV